MCVGRGGKKIKKKKKREKKSSVSESEFGIYIVYAYGVSLCMSLRRIYSIYSLYLYL